MILSGAAALSAASPRHSVIMKISKIKHIMLSVINEVSFTCRKFNHWYGNGRMYAKHIIALAIGNIFRVSDRELPEELKSRGLLKILGYKNMPNHSIFSKVRKALGEEIIGQTAGFVIQQLYKNRSILLIAIDSTFVPYWFKKDKNARLGHATLSRKENEMLNSRIKKEFGKKHLKRGYKLHAIYDVETGIPLYWIVLSANIHDKIAFKTLFDYVNIHFRIAHNAKFLADSAYDSRDIRFVLRESGFVDVIAINGRGHYKSSIPNDPDYRKRTAIERFNSIMKMKLNLLYVRFNGIKSVTAHVSSCIFGYLIKYIL